MSRQASKRVGFALSLSLYFRLHKLVIEAEMAKLSVLAVEILRVHLAFKEITVLSFESVLNDLQTWLSRLPSDLSLAHAGSLSLPPSTARSILHLHLLHKGAIILVYAV